MTVTLQFQQLEELARFKSFLQTNNIEINIHHFTLTCDCTQDELKKAVDYCGAKEISSRIYLVEAENAG